MHRNTALVIVFLGLFAAAVVGVNMARIGSGPATAPQQQTENPQPTITEKLLPTQAPVALLRFDLDGCGVSLSYPATFSKITNQNGATTFLDPASPIDATTVQCKNTLIKQYTAGSSTSTVEIGSISATLYSPPVATGSAVEKERLYFRNPATKKDIMVAGSGTTF